MSEVFFQIKRRKYSFLSLFIFYITFFGFIEYMLFMNSADSTNVVRFFSVTGVYLFLTKIQFFENRKLKFKRNFVYLFFLEIIRNILSLNFITNYLWSVDVVSMESYDLVLFVPLFVIFNVFSFYVLARSSFGYQLLVVDGLSINDAFFNSVKFIKGKVWKIFGPFLFLTPIYICFIILTLLIGHIFEYDLSIFSGVYILLFFFLFFLFQNVQYKLLRLEIIKDMEDTI